MNINPFNEYKCLNVNFDFIQKGEDRAFNFTFSLPCEEKSRSANINNLNRRIIPIDQSLLRI
jgi:hypothetical protein